MRKPRTLKWHWALALFGMLLTSVASGAPQSAPNAPLAATVVSWNIASRQFIDAPTFELMPLKATAMYRAIVKQGEQTWRVDSKSPRVSLTEIWPRLATKRFNISFVWLDANGKDIASDAATTRTKAPDFAGFHEPPADWRGAADRGLAFLLRVGKDAKPPYQEPGVPTWIWSAYGVNTHEPEADMGYPALFVPSLIDAFVASSQAGSDHAADGMAMARTTADWAMQHRQPKSGALPLFPFSTISHGHFTGGLEGQSVNLMRANWFAAGLLELYKADGQKRVDYLEYARHIAHVTAKFQAPDGSFPYRLNPATGAVVEPYTPAAIQFVRLIDALSEFDVEPDLIRAQQRALQWMTSYVIRAHHWQACFEDVPMTAPYSNLSQFEAEMTIQYLCRHRAENPDFVPMAVDLERWVEDQFVDFGPESEAFDHPVKGPLVFEQFACWAPMEVHTALWIDSLLALHTATGKQEYLDKAKAAGNAICAQQFDDGAFSTFGARRFPDGKSAGTQGTWFNCNATAIAALYRLDTYCQRH